MAGKAWHLDVVAGCGDRLTDTADRRWGPGEPVDDDRSDRGTDGMAEWLAAREHVHGSIPGPQALRLRRHRERSGTLSFYQIDRPTAARAFT